MMETTPGDMQLGQYGSGCDPSSSGILAFSLFTTKQDKERQKSQKEDKKNEKNMCRICVNYAFRNGRYGRLCK
jgi:hypothetical protein